jgi:hypothetical protein
MKALALFLLFAFVGCGTRHHQNWEVEQDAQPSETHPYGGFWKINSQDQWGLAIGPYGKTSYYVSFCGPRGCFTKGEYRAATSLVGDPQYRVLDMNHLDVNGKKGFTTYQRSNGRKGSEFVQR